VAVVVESLQERSAVQLLVVFQDILHILLRLQQQLRVYKVEVLVPAAWGHLVAVLLQQPVVVACFMVVVEEDLA
jgi:hypothetical protein